MKKFSVVLLFGFILLVSSGCVYYNTFYHAKKAFNKAESARKKDTGRNRANINKGDYNTARDKSAKVIENYPTSKYYDDALYVNGVSNYYLEDYNRAEKRFRELLANFPESEYTRNARLYLAKSKLKLGDMTEARALFERLFAESKEKEVKAEAAMALGEYHFENKEYEKSREFFNSIIDSLGNNEEKKAALLYNADGYFSRFQFRQALDSYLGVLDLDPTTKEKYQAIYNAGRSCYFLNDIDQGMDYFYQLADDPFYYDSLGAIKLQIAEGFELNSDLILAEETYREVAVEFPSRAPGAIANYNLGLIYQYDYEDYPKAKEFYDKAKIRSAGDDIYQDALQRSTDIGKLEEYSERIELDTSATTAEIDSAAYQQYLLGELYMYQLDKPDSAYQEFKYIIDNFPSSYFTPKAMIAAAAISRDYYEDTVSCDSMLRMALKEYPRSDFAPEVIDLLGLAGTVADTGYAGYYFKKAESFAFDKEMYDSAKYYYEFVADSFPNSKYATKAKFAAIWVQDEYASPGDSSIYYAYSEFVDSFPRTEFAQVANQKINVPERRVRRDDPDDNSNDTTTTISIQDLRAGDEDELKKFEGDNQDENYLTPEEKVYIDPDGNTIEQVEQGPFRCDQEFIYPASAYSTDFEGSLVFQIKLDAFGEIVDHRLMTPSPSKELDDVVTEVVLNCHWDTGWMDPEEYNTWFVYKYAVRLPAGARQ